MVSVIGDMLVHMSGTLTDYEAEAERQLGGRRPGWVPLLAQLLVDVAAVDPDAQLSGGQKFGRLRVDAHDNSDPAVQALIWAAADQSTRTCETCGAEGKALWCFTWVSTLCPQHALSNRGGRRPAEHWPPHANLSGPCPECGYAPETDS